MLIHKNYTAGYAIFIHKGLYSKITETAHVSMLALKLNKMPKLGIESVGHISKHSTTTEASKKHY